MSKAKAGWLAVLAAANLAVAAPGEEGELFRWSGGARALGMGKAFVAVADDASASYWNPSGLAQVSGAELSVLQAALYESSSFGFLAGALPVAPGHVLGVNAVWLTTGGIEGRDALNVSTGIGWMHQRLAATVAYGGEWARGFRVGFAIKGLQRTQGDRATGFLSGDVGVHWTPVAGVPFHLGFVAQHVASQRLGDTADELSSVVRAGAVFSLVDGVMLAADVDGRGAWHVGSELAAWSVFRMRAGLDAWEQAAGFGVVSGGVGLDYAAALHRELGLSHRVSVTLKLGEGRGQ